MQANEAPVLQVIKALELAAGCAREDATLLATIVDREV
jgi:hypothetical protein